MVDEDLASGRLVALTDQAVPSGSSYWLVTSQTEFQKPEVKLFQRWFLAELGIGEHRKIAQAKTATSKPARPGSRTAQSVAR